MIGSQETRLRFRGTVVRTALGNSPCNEAKIANRHQVCISQFQGTRLRKLSDFIVCKSVQLLAVDYAETSEIDLLAISKLQLCLLRIEQFQLLQLLAEYFGCLLYTSPSPRDLSTSRMPSSA